MIAVSRNFDPLWPHGHVTRNGDTATIVYTSKVNKSPYLTVINVVNDVETPFDMIFWFHEDGRLNEDRNDGLDLINAPEPTSLCSICGDHHGDLCPYTV